MVHELLFETVCDEVPRSRGHARQDVHNLDAGSAARGEVDRLLHGGMIRRNGINVDENAGERDHSSPPVAKAVPVSEGSNEHAAV